MTREEQFEQALRKAETVNTIPEDLRVIVEQAFAEARRELANGEFVGLVLVRMADGAIQKAPIPVETAQVLNIGEAKKHFFDGLRGWVERFGVTAVVLVNDAWIGMPTERGLQVQREDPEEYRRVSQDTETGFGALLQRGWIRRAECLLATVQTDETVALIQQPYDRTNMGVMFSERTTRCFPQEQFGGRSKMYGKEKNDHSEQKA